MSVLYIQVIEIIKKDILSALAKTPKAFLEKLTSILNQGSIHFAADQFNGRCGASSSFIFISTMESHNVDTYWDQEKGPNFSNTTK